MTKKGKSGIYYWADRETYISLGFNTSHIPAAEAPKRLNDLLDPKWKGKMSLAGGGTAASPPPPPPPLHSNIFVAKRKGAPVEWRPLDPVVANVGYSGILAKAPHPHAALLFIDYLHSKEGQQFIVKGGLSSPRDDVESLVNQKFKKTYFEAKYSVEEYEKKLSEWEELIQKVLTRRR